MIRIRLDDLRRKKGAAEGRDLTIRIMEKETGLSKGTLIRAKNGPVERIFISTLDTLCQYFDISEISELVEYIPNPTTEKLLS